MSSGSLKLRRQIQRKFVLLHHLEGNTAEKMEFLIRDFLNKCDQIRTFHFFLGIFGRGASVNQTKYLQ